MPRPPVRRLSVLSPDETLLIETLRDLRAQRRQRLEPRRPRLRLSPDQRTAIAAKTDGRCHICGGLLDATWHADHVRSHSAGGTHAVENYLAAHATCNNYRWDYLPEEFQWTLKIGVWARLVMEKQDGLGEAMTRAFAQHEKTRARRRRKA